MSQQKNEMLYSMLNKAYNFFNNALNQNEMATGAVICLGEDVEKALAVEPLLSDMYQRGDDNLPKMLQSYPLHIMTTLLAITQKMSFWDPKKSVNDPKYAKYKEYISNIIDTGMFMVESKLDTNIQYTKFDYKELLEKITSRYSFVDIEEQKKIYNSLHTLMQNSLSNAEQNDTSILFTHTLLSSRKNVCNLTLASSKIDFIFDKEIGKIIPEKSFSSEIKLSISQFRFTDFNLSPDDIKMIIDLDFTLLSDWLEQNNTPPKDEDYMLCFN